MFRNSKSQKRLFSLTEYPDLQKASTLWKHPEIHPDQVTNFKKYCDEAIKEGSVKVDYIRYKPYGRYFVKDTKKISSCPMWSKLRSTLFAEKEYDVDVVACHQSILYDLLLPHKDKYKLDALKRYVDDRDGVIEEMTIKEDAIARYNKKNNCYSVKRDCIKSLFTIMLYGGIVDTWKTEWGFDEDDYDLSDFVNEFEEELKWNTAVICNMDTRFTDIVKWKKADLLEVYKNKHPEQPADKRQRKKGIDYFDTSKYKINEGKILSIILQDFETQIVEVAMEWTREIGCTLTSYNYDGFQILKAGVPDDYIDKLNEKIQWNNIKFIKKEFKPPLEMSEIKEASDEFDYDEYLICEDYEYRKNYFEKFHFKSLNPVCYVKIFPDGELQHISHDKLEKMYKHLKAKYWCPEAQKEVMQPFLIKWLSDAGMLHYTKIGFYPPPLPTPYRHFNMWCDFPILKTPLKEVEGREKGQLFKETQIIHDHFLLMAGKGDKNGLQSAEENKLEIKEYLLNWFAHLCQFPARKTEVCVILKGEQGAGKSTIGEKVMAKIFGDEKLFITGRTDKAFGKFSNLQGKLLCILNEAQGKDTHDMDSVLKDVITAHKIQLEKKCIDIVEVIDYSNFMFTTNGFNMVKMPKDDRRMMVVHCDNSKKNNAVYFIPLYKAVNDLNTMRMFYQELMERDLSNFHPSNDRPYTFISETLKRVNADYIDEFVQWLDMMNDYEWNSPSEVYDKFNSWWVEKGRKTDQKPHEQKFLGMVVMHDDIKKRRVSYGFEYQRINPSSITSHFSNS